MVLARAKAMIGGTLFTHNCFELDYCLEASLYSLQGICDEIQIVDADSTDGTWPWLLEEASVNPSIKLQRTAWNPGEMGLWLSGLANKARLALKSNYHLGLQADEVLHTDDYVHIRNAAKTGHSYTVRRLNFWKDSNHVTPHPVCSETPIRLAPKMVPFGGDAESLEARGIVEASSVRLYHYGFLRKYECMRKKGIMMEDAFFGAHNAIYDAPEFEGKALFDNIYPVLAFCGPHPAVAIPWLKAHGFE